MRKLVALAIASLVLAGASRTKAEEPGEKGRAQGHATAATTSFSVGAQVNVLPVKDNKGETFGLETFRRTDKTNGKIVVLTFWCSSCGSCRQIDNRLDKRGKEYDGKGVVVVAVDSNFDDGSERVNTCLAERKLGFRVLMDSESDIARSFGARFTTTTVIDADGRLRYYGSFEKAEAAVNELLAGKDVTVPTSRGSGCAIMLKPREGEERPRAHGDRHGPRHGDGSHDHADH